MTCMISKNYIVAAIMLAKKELEIKEEYVTLNEYQLFCKYLYNEFNEKNVDALILSDELNEDDFLLDYPHNCISLNKNIFSLEQIKARYCGYLPIDVLFILFSENSKNALLQIIIDIKRNEIEMLKREIKKLEMKKTQNMSLNRSLTNK